MIPYGPKKFHWRLPAGIVRRDGRRVRLPVRHRVVHVRVLAELGDRGGDGLAVLDLQLLGAAGQPGDRRGARVGRHVRGHTAPHALRVFHDDLIRHVVSGQCARGQQQQRPEGADQGEEAAWHWVTVDSGVYERRNTLTIGKL